MHIKAYDWIASHAERTPNAIAMEDLFSNRRYSYQEMNDRVGRLARHLGDTCGMQQGDRVASLSLNNTEMLEMQFACQRIGAIWVPLNFRLAIPELEYIAGDCDIKMIVTDREFEQTSKAVAKTHGIQHIIRTNADGSDSPYEAALSAAAPLTEGVALGLDDTMTIMYTSGTTGRAKGAMISYSMALFNTINCAGLCAMSADSVNYAFMPLFHTGGLNIFALPVLHSGGRVLIARNFDPGECLRVMSDPQHGVTHTLAVPAMLLAMQQHPEFEKSDLGIVRGFFVGGAPVPVPLLKKWLAAGVKLQQGFGMTETGPASLCLNADDAELKVGSTGKPLLHVDVKVVDNDGQEVKPGEMGELWLKGPSITTGYWNNPEANEKGFTDGWLHSGDAAMVDEDGYYYIVDRTKDMYISGGENVYPAEVEEIIYQLDGIVEVAIIGVEDEKWGEIGRAIAVISAESDISEASIIKHCLEQLAKYKVPRSVVFTDALPRNVTGKILKTELREQYG